MIGKIFITRSGYDPERGRHVKDPYLGKNPSLGACRPDIRKTVKRGDLIFAVSGMVHGIPQFVMGGFEVEEKIHASEAHKRFPERRLHLLPDGQVSGNIIVDGHGSQHGLDDHDSFETRLPNYIVGRNGLALETRAEIRRGRAETMDVLREILDKDGSKPVDLISRFGCSLTEEQAKRLYEWLRSIKSAA